MVFQGCFGNHDEKMQEGWLWSCARKLQGPLKEQEIRIIAAEVESVESVESVLIYCRMIVSAMRGFHLFNFGKILQKWELAWHDGTWNMKGWALLSPGWNLLKFQTCPQVTNATFACTPLNVAFFFGAQNQHLLLLHTAAYVDVESTSMAEDPGCVNLGCWQVTIRGLKSELDSFLLYHTLLRLTTDVPSTCPWCSIKVPLISWVRCSRSRRIPMSNMRLYLEKRQNPEKKIRWVRWCVHRFINIFHKLL